MHPQRYLEVKTPFLPVEGRVFTASDRLRDDPLRAGFIGRAVAIQALTKDGLIFVQDPDSSGQIAFYHTQGIVEPPLHWLDPASSDVHLEIAIA
jgi:hypothetical protein